MNIALLDEVHRLWLEASREDRLYSLVSNGRSYRFYTGRVPGDRQVIAFWDGADEVALLQFDRSGLHIGYDRRCVQPLPDGATKSSSDDGPMHDHFGHAFGFVPCPISVRRFHETKWRVSVEPLAGCYLDFDRDPVTYTEGDEDELLDMTEIVRQWVEQGRFAFTFYNEFWMNAEGDVVCS
jgi:hypothetical protein